MSTPAGIRHFVVALCLCVIGPGGASAADEAPVFTTLAVAPVYSPRPFAGSDGRIHSAYELSLVNTSRLVVEVTSIAALDGVTGATLGEWKGDDLRSVFRINGGDQGVVLGPSQSALAFLDATLPAQAKPLSAIRHRITATRMEKAPGDDLHKGLPLPANAGIPAEVSFLTPPMPVDQRPAIRLAPPLKGPGWVAVNGCCDTITSHRGAVMAFNGVMKAPERFAIDFVAINADRQLFQGPQDKLGSYRYFGVPVLAVAEGVVVGQSDGMAEAVPGANPPGVTIETAPGNHVVLDLGQGNFALYAHLETGSIRVKVGDRVMQGDVIGQLGNTGNTDAPHLHFHVMDGPSPLASNGLPYVFDRFGSTGRLVPSDDFFAGKPAVLDQNWNVGSHQDQLPLNNVVVDFPE